MNKRREVADESLSERDDSAEDEEELRFGSPVKHREHREIASTDEIEVRSKHDMLHQGTKGIDRRDTLRVRSVRERKVTRRGHSPVSQEDVVLSITSDRDNDNDSVGEGTPSSPKGKKSNMTSRAMQHFQASEMRKDSSQSTENEDEACPEKLVDEAPITIANVNITDLRRKRLKKVSNYILGPLLGEGVYGVVRDAIDISANPQCASLQKASGSPTKSKGGPMNGFPSGVSSGVVINATHQQFHRCAVKMMPVPSAENEHKSLMTGGKRHSGLTQNHGSVLRAAFKKEVENLQRFHCPYIMRAIDLFSRYGKEYIVLPIGICSLQQFISRRREYAIDGKQWLAKKKRYSVSSECLEAHYGIPISNEHTRGEDEQNTSNHTDINNETSDESEKDSFGSSRSSSVSLPSPTLVLIPSLSPHSSPSSSPRELHRGGPTQQLHNHLISSPIESDPLTSPRHSKESTRRNSSRTTGQRSSLFSATLIKGAFYQVLSAVSYLHRQNLAHNDIKPANILLFEDGSLRLTDLAGISSQYNDQGTPLFASPELAKYFYQCSGSGDSTSRSSNDTSEVKVDAKANDMWCCGLVLYALVTGRPGPLSIQRQYDEFHSDPDSKGKHYPMNRFQLYNIIAQQNTPVDLSDIPLYSTEHLETEKNKGVCDSLPATQQIEKNLKDNSSSSDGRLHSCSKRENSLRDLLSGLLEVEPTKRLTAEEALRHPWMELKFARRGRQHHRTAHLPVLAGGVHETRGSPELQEMHCPSNNDSQTDLNDPTLMSSNDPIALSAATKDSMNMAVQREVAQRVLASTHFRDMILRDKQRHLQFVADCCNTLKIPIPPEILISSPASIITDERERSKTSMDPSGAAMGKVVRYGMPAVMPKGCVDPRLFLPESEADYYERKGGMPEFDIRSLLEDENCMIERPSSERYKNTVVPIKVQQLEEYLHNVVMVELGYRTSPDPCYMAEGAGQFLQDNTYRMHKHGEKNKNLSPNVDGLGLNSRNTAGVIENSDGGHATTESVQRHGQRPGDPNGVRDREAERRVALRQRGRGRHVNEPSTVEMDRLHESSRCFCGLV